METLKEYEANFRKNHFAVFELVDEQELIAQQAILDDHTDRVTEFQDRLLQLLPVPEKVSQKAPVTNAEEG